MIQHREFEGFFREYQNSVQKLIAGYVGNRETAEDLAVEAFIRVFNRWNRIRKMENPAGYLMRTGINLAKTYLRDRGKLRTVDITENPASKPLETPDNIFFRNEDNRTVERQLLRLKEKERNIVIMKDISGHTLKEISDVLDVKLPTVKSLYRRAKLKLTRNLGEHHES